VELGGNDAGAHDLHLDAARASLRGLELGEIVCAPGVERVDLIHAVSAADLALFGAQSPELAERYR
jgi:hypothetical protein